MHVAGTHTRESLFTTRYAKCACMIQRERAQHILAGRMCASEYVRARKQTRQACQQRAQACASKQRHLADKVLGAVRHVAPVFVVKRKPAVGNEAKKRRLRVRQKREVPRQHHVHYHPQRPHVNPRPVSLRGWRTHLRRREHLLPCTHARCEYHSPCQATD